MNIRLKERLASVVRQRELGHRLILLALVYVGVAAILLGFVLELRSEALAFTKRGLAAFLQLTEEQTTQTLQNAELTLDVVEARVAAEIQGGAVTAEQMSTLLRDLLLSRPALRAITLLDERGRIVYSSEPGRAGLDLSDREYFIHHRSRPGSGFLLSAPVRARTTAEWIIPVSRPMWGPYGDFAGVIVASLDPKFFSERWTNDKTIEAQTTTLWRNDGVVMMRSPFEEKNIGVVIKTGAIAEEVGPGRSNEGTLQAISVVDGKDRLIAYRRILAYPGFSLSVTQETARALAPWRKAAWLVALGWAAAGAALAWLALGLLRENAGRRASQDRYSLIFKANPYPMAVMDVATRRLVAINDAAVAEYGWSREEVLSMSANEFYPPEELPALEARRQADMPREADVVRGFHHRRKDGTIFSVEMHTRAIELDGRPKLLTIMENVTERRAIEEQLRQAQKMEAVGRLTGGIAHDFNNILSVILANVDIEDEVLTAAEMTDRMSRIGEAVDRASTLTRQLLAFSRKLPLNPKRTQLNDLVAGTGRLLRRALGEHIELDAVLADNLWQVNVDRAQVETALVNLCINARDAMSGGGRLLIETTNVTLDHDYVGENPDAVAGDYVLISVSDSGTGIPPEVLSKVFEPFFTTKEVGKGTGLGLSMVYGFIKQSEGHIEIESEVGRGTKVKLYLPRSVSGGDDVEADRQRAALPGGSERLLVVEDDPQVRNGVVRQLRSLGYAVTEAADAAAGIAAFAAAARPFDLLLTDVMMPGEMNGRLLAEEVVRRWPSTRVVFMSGYAANIIFRQDQLDSGLLLLSKPFRKIDLARMIRRGIAGPDGLPRPAA